MTPFSLRSSRCDDLAGQRMFEQTLQRCQALQSSFNNYDSLGRLTHVGNATGFAASTDPNLDARTYVCCNSDIYNAWLSDAHGLSIEEVGQWHYGLYGRNEAREFTGRFTATSAQDRANSIKGVGLADYQALACNVDEAYLMLEAGEAIRADPRPAGYACADLSGLVQTACSRPHRPGRCGRLLDTAGRLRSNKVPR